jgi:hypothetical protein
MPCKLCPSPSTLGPVFPARVDVRQPLMQRYVDPTAPKGGSALGVPAQARDVTAQFVASWALWLT